MPSKIQQAIKLKGSPGPEVPTSTALLANPDLVPVRPDQRLWTAKNYFFFWWSDGCNLNTFQIAATSIVAGLSWWQAWLSVIVGYGIVAVFTIINARGPAVYHIGFPVISRSSFGLWGSFWPVFQRAVMACVWQGVQAYLGGQCVTLVLRSIFPSYASYGPGGSNNHINSSSTSSQGVLSFALFNILNFICLWPSPQRIRHLFTAKSIVVPIAAVALLIWTLVEAKGAGNELKKGTTLSGSTLAWTWIAACMSCVSNMATLLTNTADFSRLANKPSAVALPQLIGIPFTFAITSLIGILISSASVVIYNKGPQWNPLDVLALKLDADPYNSGSRAGVFFIGAAFVVAQLGTNVAANSLSAGHDLAALMPRYISIRRGQIICWAVGFSYCPWIILSSSSNFATYLSAFSVFLSSVVGVMIADYWIVRRGSLDIKSLYSTKATDGGKSLYYYTYGFNWRAYTAYICGLAVNMAGFVGVCSGSFISKGVENAYHLAFFIGFFTAFFIYIVLHYFFPIEDGVSLKERNVWREPVGSSWEAADWEVPVYADEACPAYYSGSLARAGSISQGSSDDGFVDKEKDASSQEGQTTQTLAY